MTLREKEKMKERNKIGRKEAEGKDGRKCTKKVDQRKR